jgi:hypothetical protein
MACADFAWSQVTFSQPFKVTLDEPEHRCRSIMHGEGGYATHEIQNIKTKNDYLLVNLICRGGTYDSACMWKMDGRKP